MATNKAFKQLASVLAVAVIAATAHGVFFAPTEAATYGAPAAGIRLSTWDHYQQQWSIYFVEEHLNDAVNNPGGTIRHGEGAIIELRPVAGELTFDQVPAGLAYTVINDLNALGITAPGAVPVDKDGVEQPQLAASGTPVYIQLNVSTVATSVPPPVNHVGPWAGPLDPTDDDLAALDAGGSVGKHSVTLGATADTVSFTWDISRWAKGDLFLGLNNHTYKVLDRTGHFKRFVATADLDDPDHAAFEWYNETSGCATNWKTGEMFATNFGDGMPAVNVVTRQPSAVGPARTLYSPLSRRVSTRIERPDFWSWWGIDSNPESVVFDANMNMYVGHSSGNQDDRPVVGDKDYWNGMGFDMFDDSMWYPMGVDGLPREWSGGGSGFIVDETGAKLKLAEAGAPFASYVERVVDLISPRMQYENDGATLKFGPAPPALPGMPDWPAQLPLGYLASPSNGNAYQRLDANGVIVEGLVPARWSMGKRLHRYNIQPDGSYIGTGAVAADRDVFWTFTGRQGTDWMDINAAGDVLYYTSEDSFIHRYRVRLSQDAPAEPIGQLPDLGNGRIEVPGSADRRFNGLRILPPGDGTGGFLVASTGAIHRLRGDGSWVQSYAIADDAYLLASSGSYSGAAVNGWYSIEVDPGGRTLWAAPTDTGWVYVFDIATGKELHRFEATDYQPYGHPNGARFVQSMCIMWEYTAAQEICGNFLDDDGDGFVDENCKAIEICSVSSPGDDNGDGLADANDPDCGPDEAPVAEDDFFETVQDVPFGIAVSAANQVLRNDSDPDNASSNNVLLHDVLTVGLVGTSGTPATVPGGSIATTQGGTVLLNADGSMSYMPPAGFHGLDTFVYQATDAVIPFEGQNYSNIATVTILVRPLVDNDTYEIEQGTSLDVSASSTTPPALLSNDRSDGLTIIGAGPSGITPLGVNPSIQFVYSSGSGATVVVYADGRFTYTPPSNFVGTDTFLYRGNDGVSDSVNDALVTIVVKPVSTTIVTTDPDPSVYGTPATVRATVTCGASQTPSVGTVTFRLGAQVIAANVPVVNGVATTTLPAALVVGNYTVTAEYSGSAAVAPLCPGSGDDDPHQVVPKPATVTANPQTKPYGTVFTFTGTEFTTDGFIFEDEVLSATLVSATGSPATATVAGSTYPIVPSVAVGVGLENYTITYINGPLTVTPVPLVVTADDKSKMYDGTVFGGPFTVTYSGFVGGDDVSDLGGTLTFSGAAGTAVNAGTYTDGIVPAGYTSTNYTITYVPGTLVINPIPATLRANDKSMVEGDPVPTLDGAWTGLLAGELVGATYSTTGTSASPAGTYPIDPTPVDTQNVLANYTVTIIPGTLTIRPRIVPCTPTGYITYTQGGWGSTPSGGNPGALLAANFATVYPQGVMIGGTHTLTFTSAKAIETFLPAGGTSKTLTASAVDPTKSTAGVFAGQLLALQLAVDFSEAGVLQSGLGAMVMKSGSMAGKSVNEILTIANQVLGGNTSVLPSGMSISGLSSLLESIIMNYHEGVDRGGLACGSGYPPPPPPVN